MTTLQSNITDFLRRNPGAWTTAEIAQAVTAHGDEVQRALHKLDDDGWVRMRCGLYRISERAKQ